MPTFFRKHPPQGFNITELLVLLTVLAVLASLLVPYFTGNYVKSTLISTISETRQIHIAAMSMATDGEASKDEGLGWPGDLKANGRIATVSDYVNILVRYDYLKPGDLKVFACAGMTPYPGGTLTSGSNGVLKPPFEEKYNAFKIFLVKEKDAPDTIFLTSKNYTYNTPLDPNAKPFGAKGFVVCRKAGDASYYKNTQALSPQLIGPLPGGGTTEGAGNCLNPGKTGGQ